MIRVLSISSTYPSDRRSISPNDMQVRSFTYADPTPYYPTNSSALWTFHERMWGYFECPFPSKPKHFGYYTPDWIRTRLYTSRGSNNVAPILDAQQLILFGSYLAWGQRNADHWPKSIETSLMKLITYYFGWILFVLLPRTTVFAAE